LYFRRTRRRKYCNDLLNKEIGKYEDKYKFYEMLTYMFVFCDEVEKDEKTYKWLIITDTADIIATFDTYNLPDDCFS
jgi:hypothetical protein